MRLDHLLSKEEKSRGKLLSIVELSRLKLFGGDALRGNTRSHPEHDG